MMLIALAVILGVLLIAVGGEQGLKSYFATFLNIAIMLGYVILVAQGISVWPITCIAVIGFVAVTLFYQFGWNLKTEISMISSCIILLMASGVIYWFVHGSRIAGLNEVELSTDLGETVSNNVAVNMTSVMIIVVLLGTLGAVVDTAISIATALFEMKKNHPEITRKNLVKSGWQVGKDILGTTVNTLCIAGLGEIFMLGIFFVLNDFTIARLLNSEAIFQELATILIGNTACLLIIPLTNFMMSYRLSNVRQV